MTDEGMRTRAVVATEPDVFALRDVVLRSPERDEVVVELRASAMCVTDALGLRGHGLTPFPLIPGHSAVGTVIAAGRAVSRVAAGDTVAITGTAQCGTCYFCRHGSPSACEQILGGMSRSVGVLDDGSVVHVDGGIGTMAEHMLYRECNVVAIGDLDVPDEHLAMLGCGISSGVGAVLEVASVRTGDSVAVSGCGPLGLWMVQAAALAGADPIVAIEPDPRRRTVALAVGATHATPPGEPARELIRELTEGRGVDVSFEAAGSTAVMEESFALARNGGTVIPTGMESPSASVTLNGYEYALNAKRILSSQTGGGDIVHTIPRFARLLGQGALDASPVHSRSYPLSDFAGALRDAVAHDVLTGVVVMRAGG